MPWIIAIILLLGYELWALATGHRTLSQMIYDIYKDWPFLGVLVGLVVGGLLVHFFWQWCPDGSTPSFGWRF